MALSAVYTCTLYGVSIPSATFRFTLLSSTTSTFTFSVVKVYLNSLSCPAFSAWFTLPIGRQSSTSLTMVQEKVLPLP